MKDNGTHLPIDPRPSVRRIKELRSASPEKNRFVTSTELEAKVIDGQIVIVRKI